MIGIRILLENEGGYDEDEEDETEESEYEEVPEWLLLGDEGRLEAGAQLGRLAS